MQFTANGVRRAVRRVRNRANPDLILVNAESFVVSSLGSLGGCLGIIIYVFADLLYLRLVHSLSLDELFDVVWLTFVLTAARNHVLQLCSLLT